MTPFLWFAVAMLVLTAVPATVSFALYLGTGIDLWQARALRFWRWAVLVVLITFNVTIFKHVFLTLFEIIRNR